MKKFPVGISKLQKIFKECNYAQKCIHQYANVFLIGMEFNETERNLTSFQCEKVNQ